MFRLKRFIFWTELGTQRIGRAHMDGTSIQYIVTVHAYWPNGVAIDFTGTPIKAVLMQFVSFDDLC